MADEAKEIERLGVVLRQWRRFDELESQQIYGLARRLLEEMDEARGKIARLTKVMTKIAHHPAYDGSYCPDPDDCPNCFAQAALRGDKS